MFEDTMLVRLDVHFTIRTIDVGETGEINIPNLAEPYSAVCGGLTGLLFSGIRVF